MFERSEIQKGMTVRSIDGHKLGRIVDITDEELIVEKGFFRRRDFAVRFSDVREVAHGEVLLQHGQDSLFAAPREVPHQVHSRKPLAHLPLRSHR
ncbi:PRC-barrel domain-containing protein [Hyalangium versicolor]|uniref:PRC-barrel domain-containing protein n=1 Tax=Hyalangium versicolor TaxID=2861190 RepID=UPI001CC95D08|nr:PRC-barrel domain-containing protein [Hyalangium versicolor]